MSGELNDGAADSAQAYIERCLETFTFPETGDFYAIWIEGGRVTYAGPKNTANLAMAEVPHEVRKSELWQVYRLLDDDEYVRVAKKGNLTCLTSNAVRQIVEEALFAS